VSGGPRFFIRSWRESPGRREYEKLESERRVSDTAATTNILREHSPFLRHLELASGLTSVRDLATITWPSLQTLTLTGPCPSHKEFILPIIRAMPALLDLQIIYSWYRPRYCNIYWCVCPSNPVTGTMISSTLTLATCSPTLRSLTLSNPHPADTVFGSIPPSLESLTLPSIHEWPHKTNGMNLTFAARIMRDVSVCGARLRVLRLFVNCEPSVGFLKTIVQHFPFLEILHLGIDVWPRGTREDITTNFLEQYAEVLIPLFALRELYLGLCLPESLSVHAYASVFCHRLPSLEVVGMQQVDIAAFYHPARVEWCATYVTRGPIGLEYHDICEPLLS